MSTVDKKTSLYEQHLQGGGKIVSFAGFSLPVQYSAGVISEHMAVRQNAGIFDVSHMGEAIIEGKDAAPNLNMILTNTFDDMPDLSCRYTLMLYPDGTQVDDLIVYKINSEKFLLVLNASNTEKDIEWLKKNLQGECTITDISEKTAQIALQGPNSDKIIEKICDIDTLPKKYYTFAQNVKVATVNCLVSKTGYTGERGYEIYMEKNDAPIVWQALVENGAVMCGLGCRDTLRLEAAMPLYGHELSDKIHVGATGLNFAIKKHKENYIGKQAVDNPPENLPVRVGLKATDRGVVRENEAIFVDEQQIGMTTSGTHCPYLGGAYAMAYVNKDSSEVGTQVHVVVRGRKINMVIVPLPFYKAK